MPPKCRLQALEPERFHEHHRLKPGDSCYYIGEYTSRQGFDYSEINSLISNLKKSPLRRQHPEWQYKIGAINWAAHCLRNALGDDDLNDYITLIPIPPSKAPDHPEYDPRMRDICLRIMAPTEAKPAIETPDVQDILHVIESGEPSHISDERLSPEDLAENLRLAPPPNYVPRNHIVLLDDVLTTGSHYKACQRVLSEEYPEAAIHGIFVARRVFPSSEDDFKNLVWE